MTTSLPKGAEASDCVFWESVEFSPNEQATNAWLSLFLAMPFTNFWIIDFLVKKADTTYQRLWEKPRTLKDLIPTASITHLNHQELLDLAFKPGTCSAFAIQMSYYLQPFAGGPDNDDFEFTYYSEARHRLVHSEKFGIVINSSRCGPYVIDRGGNVSDNPVEAVSRPETTMRALIQNLTKPKLEPLCYFRSAQWTRAGVETETSYHGMIKWVLKEKQLWLVPEWTDQGRAQMIKFVWDGGNNTKERKNYAAIIAAFVYTHGGTMRANQWRSCHQLFRHYWDAACAYGFPRVEIPESNRLRMPAANNWETACINTCSMYAVNDFGDDGHQVDRNVALYHQALEQMDTIDRMATAWPQLKEDILSGKTYESYIKGEEVDPFPTDPVRREAALEAREMSLRQSARGIEEMEEAVTKHGRARAGSNEATIPALMSEEDQARYRYLCSIAMGGKNV